MNYNRNDAFPQYNYPIAQQPQQYFPVQTSLQTFPAVSQHHTQIQNEPQGNIPLVTTESTPLVKTVENDEAIREHIIEKLPFRVPLEEIERRYGRGLRTFFDFHRAIIYSNLFLIFVGLTNYVPYLVMFTPPRVFSVNYLFTSSYPANMYHIWMYSTLFGVLVWFVFPFIFLKWMRLRPVKIDHDNPFLFVASSDLIPGNNQYSSKSRFGRLVVSILVSLILIGSSGAITFFLQELKASKQVSYHSLSIMDFVVTGAISIINILWNYIFFFSFLLFTILIILIITTLKS